jgi:hypothetical protein
VGGEAEHDMTDDATPTPGEAVALRYADRVAGWQGLAADIDAVIRQAVADEREACARAGESLAVKFGKDGSYLEIVGEAVTRRLVAIAALVTAALAAAQPAPPTPPATPGQSRTRLAPGQALVCWDRGGRLPAFTAGWYGQPAWTLAGPAGSVQVQRRSPGRSDCESADDPTYFGEVLAPAVPGGYTVTAGGATFTFQVAAPPARKGVQRLSPGTTVATAQVQLDKGYDLELTPGLYPWGRSVYAASGKVADLPLRVPDGAAIVGPGAVITADPSLPAPARAWQLAGVFSAPNATLDGLKFDLPDGRVCSNVYSPNLTLRRCHLAACQLNDPGPGLYMEDCEVTGPGAGVFLIQGGLLRRVTFHDTSPGHYEESAGHAFACYKADGNLAIIDCPFLRTGRGVVCQPNRGDIRGCLLLGNEIHWPRSENGREGIPLCEQPAVPLAPLAYGFHGNLILHTLAVTDGSAVQWDGAATGNLVRDYTVHGGLGFRLWGGAISGNRFDGYKLDAGATIQLDGSATGNTFVNGVGPNPAPVGVPR